MPDNEMLIMEDIPENELWGSVPVPEDEMIVRQERTLTREEEAECQLCAMFAAEIAARRDEHITSVDIDRIVGDTKAAVEELLDGGGGTGDADDAMTDSELTQLHLTAGDDDHRKARAKIIENAVSRAAGIQSVNVQQEIYPDRMNPDNFIPSM